MKIERLSWSKENRYAMCGQQFAYIYGEKLKRPPGVAMIRGIGPHRSAEADLKSKLETGALLETEAVEAVATDYIDKAFRGEVAIDGEFQGMTLKEASAVAREDARKMAARHHAQIAPTIRPTGLEVRVVAEFPNALSVPYEGVLDVVDDDATVRDLKTKRKAPGRDDAEVSEQLTRYHALFSALHERPPSALSLDFVWVTPDGKVYHRIQPTTRSEADVAVGFARARQTLAAIERDVYLPAPVDSWQCSTRYCGFTDICPYFRGRPRPTS